MSNLRSFVLAVALLFVSLAPKPAHALPEGVQLDSLGLEDLTRSTEIFGMLLVGAGTVTFAAADIAYMAQRRPIPVPWAGLQAAFGAIVTASGVAVANGGNEATAAVLIPLGTTFIALPFIDLGIRAGRKPKITAVGFTPRGVRISGTF